MHRTVAGSAGRPNRDLPDPARGLRSGDIDVQKAVFEHGADRKWLDLNQLPLEMTGDAYALFSGWSRLVDLTRLRDTLPRGRATVDAWLAAAHRRPKPSG